MKNKKNKTRTTILLFTMLFVVGLIFTQYASAQGGKGGSISAGGGEQAQDRDRIQDPTTHDGDEPIQDRDRIQDSTTTLPIQDQTRDQDRDRIQDPTTHDGDEPIQDRDRDRIHINLENVVTPAGDTQQLKATIQNREQELKQEVTDAIEEYRDMIQNHNRTRLAVYAIYASENLLGSVGQRTTQIIEQINNSEQKTISAEAEIGARGFWRHIFFGGDKDHSQILQQEQEQNRLRIQELIKLISNANINIETRNTLMEQLRLVEEEQARLGQIAEQELGQWGIFSWRF